MKQSKKIFAAAAVMMIALLFSACTVSTQTAPIDAPQASPAQQASQTEAPTQTPQATAEPEPTVVSAADVTLYVAKANSRIITREYLGGEKSASVSYVYAADKEMQDQSYTVTGYYEDQPIYSTAYFVDDEGLWGQFSDDEGEGKYLILPAVINVGVKYEYRGDASEITAVDAPFELEGFKAEHCIIVKTSSSAYGQEVMNVFAQDVGLAAQYIQYSEDVEDVIMVVDSVKTIDQTMADQIISDSKF